MDYKKLRKEMMLLINTIDALPASRELSIARTVIQSTQMWCGQGIGLSGNVSPYAENDGSRRTVEDIKPLFDHTEDLLVDDIGRDDEIRTIDEMREFLSSKKNEVVPLLVVTEHPEKKVVDEMIYIGVVEARMWLGARLGAIRDASRT